MLCVDVSPSNLDVSPCLFFLIIHRSLHWSVTLLIYFSDGELLRFLALVVLEVELDFSHVCLYIARRYDDLGTLDELALVVKSVEVDR